ncbi:MAG: 4-oxalomesaconate tautomerase [Pseudomonadota bacterium]
MKSAPVMWMRGGTSKGGFFLAEDLPGDTTERDDFLLRVMGSPDPRQIDGMGGADPLTSKVAVVRRSAREGIDVDYLFLQVSVDEARVSDQQNCGNLLAAVAPFAIERALAVPEDVETRVTIYSENTGQVAVATVKTPDSEISYHGDTSIDGVPGTHAPISLEFCDTAGSSCGALLPTGNHIDQIEGVACTLIDNGMPCVVLRAADVGATGYEDRAELESEHYEAVRRRVEAIRRAAGPLMNLGNVAEKTVPKMALISPPRNGGAITTRVFIPHRAHASIGVLGAVSVATACLLQGSTAAAAANIPTGRVKVLSIEHPSGATDCFLETDKAGEVVSAALLRTARKLLDGTVYV